MLWRRKRKAKRPEQPPADEVPEQPDLESGGAAQSDTADTGEDMTAAFVESERVPTDSADTVAANAATTHGPVDAADAPAPAAGNAPVEATEAGRKGGWLSRLKGGLSRSSSKVGGGIGSIFSKRKLDEEALEDLEDLLISADLGVDTASRLAQQLGERRFDKEVDPETVRAALAEDIAEILEPVAQPLALDPSHKPHVILVVGVNGSGKTTTIGKLAKQWTDAGYRVHLAAGDTFRAAAVEQLQIWGERTGAPVTAKETGADAAGLAYDALESARQENADVLLIDTAGRLHNKSNLMAELQKIVRVLQKLDPSAPQDTLLVLDATVGQNAVQQVQTFRELIDVTGIALTKLDGSARGGILVALAADYGLPVHAVGVGETAADLRPFAPIPFARALVGLEPEGT